MAARTRWPAMTRTSLIAMATGRPACGDEEQVDIDGGGKVVHGEPLRAGRGERVAEGGGVGLGPGVPGTAFGDLAGELGIVAAGGEGNDFEAIGELADDIEGLPSDGAGGAEDGDALLHRIDGAIARGQRRMGLRPQGQGRGSTRPRRE